MVIWMSSRSRSTGKCLDLNQYWKELMQLTEGLDEEA